LEFGDDRAFDVFVSLAEFVAQYFAGLERGTFEWGVPASENPPVVGRDSRWRKSPVREADPNAGGGF
jgi:hypothetical protein